MEGFFIGGNLLLIFFVCLFLFLWGCKSRLCLFEVYSSVETWGESGDYSSEVYETCVSGL